MKHLIFALLLALPGCAAMIFSEEARVLGKTDDGRIIAQFTVTRASAIGIPPTPNTDIARRASAICPRGYVETGRSGEITRRISGVIYTDIDVTVVCNA